ncbi:hypothetical protein AB0H76_05140 [Nocardia sp. NPDC050712]|uniref:hypothetical protein n=1 Tax=Nocardia sp. NPDC050712 TaxID=3155518 RepID=UPI0033DC9B99
MSIFRRSRQRRRRGGSGLDSNAADAVLVAGEALPWVFRVLGGVVRGLLNALN